MKVLFVSGHPQVSSQIRTSLSDDIDVVEVRTPQRALALVDEGGAFDLVIADADIAPTGGFALCRELRGREAMGTPVPPMIVLLARTQDVWLADWSQADAWILKPVDPFDFAELVAAVAGGASVPILPGMGGRPVAEVGEVPGPDHAGQESSLSSTGAPHAAARS